MGQADYLVTKAGFQSLQEEYFHLIRYAAGMQGEMKASLKYAEKSLEHYLVLREQMMIAQKCVSQYERILAKTRVLEHPPKKEQKTVHIGASMLVEIDGELHALQIVGDLEANPARGMLSLQSPIAKALLGKHEGERFLFFTPEKVEYIVHKVFYW